MGVTSSNSNQQKNSHEGEHFVQIINPGKVPRPKQVTTGGQKNSSGVVISSRARALKNINFHLLWENFLNSTASSFALTQSEVTALLLDSIELVNKVDGSKVDVASVEADIKTYVALVEELSEKDTAKTIDFMAVCSAVLLLSGISIEVKVDQLFSWIVLDPEIQEFSFDDFFIAMKSFERGLSHAIGVSSCSEGYVKSVATQWMALADPHHKGSTDVHTRISSSSFFEFCTNRQHVVRKLLELLAASKVLVDANLEMTEVSDSVDLMKGPSGGDEWMANPAWRKTAERMVPSEASAGYVNSKPASTLQLEWVHGYRGFDCRNNLFYADASGSQVIYSAAALGIVQDNNARGAHGRTQHYFGEHGDDILSLTTYTAKNSKTLIASGEIGKTPAVYLYAWSPDNNTFESLACLKGFHAKGVTQLAFSNNGGLLFSVGVEYSVALYNTEQGHKQFGKMITSSQGPKSKIMHCAKCGADSSGSSEVAFLSCGEKHVSRWKFEKGALKQETCKLGSHRNKIYLCTTGTVGGMNILGTSEGDILVCSGLTVLPAALHGLNGASGSSGHGKKAINALWSNANGDVVVSGDRDGKVVVWYAKPEGSGDKSTVTLTLKFEFVVSGHVHGIDVEYMSDTTDSSTSTTAAAATTKTAADSNTGNNKAGRKSGGAESAQQQAGGSGDAKSVTAPAVRAVAMDASCTKLLVGLQTCEILEYSFSDLISLSGNRGGGVGGSGVGGSPGGSGLHRQSSSVSVVPGMDGLVATHLVGGHFKDEVWGLAVRPVTAENAATGDVEYATVGDDGYLRIWSLLGHKQLCCVKLPGPARAVDYSPDGNYLAVGHGSGGGGGGRGRGGKKGSVDGMVKVFRFNRPANPVSGALSDDYKETVGTLSQVAEIKEAKKWISVVRYSPDGSTLAVGSRDNSIYLYSVMHQYHRKGKFTKHNSGINQLDFTTDGKFLQSCCSAYEILFSNANNGAQITDGASKFTGEVWSDWTCTLGWAVIGIWSGSMDGSDINAVHRSPSSNLIATADDFGKVNVFRFPALKDGGAQYTEYTGHSSHVTGVKWTSLPSAAACLKQGRFLPPKSDDYLISTGGEDKCVFQWKNSGQDRDRVGLKGAAAAEEDQEAGAGSAGGGQDAGGDDFFDAPTGGDEFTAVKPWLGAIVPPSAWSNPDPSKKDPYFAALGELSTQHKRLGDEVLNGKLLTGDSGDEAVPGVYTEVSRSADSVLKRLSDSGVENTAAPDSDELELEWVHGYRGFDCRNNVFFVEPHNNITASGTVGGIPRYVVYFAAALGILLDPISRTQKYFRGHSDDIVSIAVHKPSSQSTVLSAPTSTSTSTASAIVATGQQGIGNIFIWEVPSMKSLASLSTKQKNVTMLQFSIDGKRVVSISEDKNVAVCDWQSQTTLAITKGEPAPTMHIAVGPPAANGDFHFLSCGDKHIRFWTLNGRNLSAKKVLTSKCKGATIQMFLCAAEVFSKYLVGCEDGSIYVIPPDGKEVKARITAGSSTATGKAEAGTESKKGAKGGKGGKGGGGGGKIANKGAAVTALHVQHNYSTDVSCLVLAGAKNGTVTLWDASELAPATDASKLTLVKLFDFSISDLNLNFVTAKQIQALAMYTPTAASGAQQSMKEEPLLVVATRGCDLIEVRCNLMTNAAALYRPSSSNSGIIMQAHCNDELWGVATHPTRPEYCTVGDDKTLRFFSVHGRRMIHAVPLGSIARTVDYSPDGHAIAIGFGGRLGRGKESGGGIVRLYSSDFWGGNEAMQAGKGVRKLAEQKDAKEWISDVKFAADGQTLAVGAHDCKIYIYDVKISGTPGSADMEATLSLRSKFTKHNSVINHLDLSADGRFMQSNCSAYELLFCDTSTGKQITAASELKDVNWASWTCTLGWPVQGIWGAGMDGSDINAVARSHSGHILATSDDFGKVNLFRYPAVQAGAGCVSYAAHSSHVMNVRWSLADECLLSCGGNDKCLMQWRHHMADVSGIDSAAAGTTATVADADDAAAAGGDPMMDLLDGPGGGDEAGAVKPWLGAIRAPKNPPPISSQAPAVQLDLQWVHGYTSASAGAGNTRISANLHYNAEHQIIYPAAALGVLLDRGQKQGSDDDSSGVEESADGEISKSHMKQTYFVGHDDDVLCLAMSNDRRFIATGQTASKATKGKATVIVWDAVQCRLLSEMKSCHQRAVTSLAFSPDSSQLVSVGQDDSNTHILWEDKGGGWSRVQKVADCKGDKAPVLFSRWVHPSNPNVQKSEYHFLSGGASGVNFWKLDGSQLSKKQGRFSKKYKQAPLLCAANIQAKGDQWQMVLGTATGSLYMFEEREVSNAVEGAHKGPVLCVAESGVDCTFLVSGGRDKLVKVWNHSLQPISVFDLSTHSCVDGSVASLDVRPAHDVDATAAAGNSGGSGKTMQRLVLLAGTYGGEIIEITSGKPDSTAQAAAASIASSSSGGGGDNSGAASTAPRYLDLSLATAEVVLHSHYSGELWGVATHPIDSDIIATVGDDKTLRIWSIKRNSMISVVDLHWPARCVAWHPLGTALAVGFHEAVKGGFKGGGKGKSGGKKGGKKKSTAGDGDGDGETSDTHEGAIHIYSFKHSPGSSIVELKKRADGCNSIAWINDIKFSPDGRLLAAGSHDKRLYAYKLPDLTTGDVSNDGEWVDWGSCLSKPLYQFNKHSSAVLHFDFSLDGFYFQSNCQASELLFGEVETGKQETSASKLADYNGVLDDDHEGRLWATQTCKLGWPVQGIWEPGSDMSDINSVDRHVGGKLLATADDFGHVKLFRYPCVQEGSKYAQFDGHSSHVTGVRWTVANHLVSVGGNDKCVFVWNMHEK